MEADAEQLSVVKATSVFDATAYIPCTSPSLWVTVRVLCQKKKTQTLQNIKLLSKSKLCETTVCSECKKKKKAKNDLVHF